MTYPGQRPHDDDAAKWAVTLIILAFVGAFVAGVIAGAVVL